MKERLQIFAFDGASVSLSMPLEAEFSELDGLEEGTRHFTWAPSPEAFFMVSAGTSSGYTADGLLVLEAQRGRGLRVQSDDSLPLAGEGARRVVFTVTHHRPREVRDTPGGGCVRIPERDIRQLSDLLFVPGRRQHLRVGYRVDEGASDELRALLARMLDQVEIRRLDA